MNAHEDELKAALYYYLDENEYGLTGDLVCANEFCGVYWSPIQWVSPPDALTAQPGDWLYLGTAGWWPNLETKTLYERVKIWADSCDLWPGRPGEWCRLDEIDWTYEI